MNLRDLRTAPPRHAYKTWAQRTQPITHVVVHHSDTSLDMGVAEKLSETGFTSSGGDYPFCLACVLKLLAAAAAVPRTQVLIIS